MPYVPDDRRGFGLKMGRRRRFDRLERVQFAEFNYKLAHRGVACGCEPPVWVRQCAAVRAPQARIANESDVRAARANGSQRLAPVALSIAALSLLADHRRS